MPSDRAVPPPPLIGHPAIDQEHRLLIDSLQRLHDAPAGDLRSEAFMETISHLGQQIIQHFENEEFIFKACGMPVAEVVAHIAAHDEILEQYAALQDDLMRHKTLAQAAVLGMIQRWIVEHVAAHDLRMRDYIAR